jgi:hypothetical protein
MFPLGKVNQVCLIGPSLFIQAHTNLISRTYFAIWAIKYVGIRTSGQSPEGRRQVCQIHIYRPILWHGQVTRGRRAFAGCVSISTSGVER